MRPPKPQRDTNLVVVAFALALLAAAVLAASRRVHDLDEDLRIEHNRRLELEDRLEVRDQQIDGALAKIHELSPNEPAASE